MIIPDNLLRARRALDALAEVTILADWNFDSTLSLWYIKISIALEKANHYISTKTDWYVVASSEYPFGRVKVYPALKNGVSATYPHQSNNARIENNQLWRKGGLCTEVIDNIFESEPYEIDDRLAYHVRRAVCWLKAAVDGTLVQAGSLFELPDFPSNSSLHFAFSEDSVTSMQWESTDEISGTADLGYVGDKGVFVKTFRAFSNQVVHSVDWGTCLSKKTEEKSKALWIMLKHIPTLNIWQAPTTLIELVDALADQGVDFFDFLKCHLNQFRDGKRHFLLLGFPIPKYNGDEPYELFWQGLLLPAFSYGSLVQKGFRRGEAGWWHNDKATILKSSLQLEWIDSANWSDEVISSRGKLPRDVRACSVAIIGCGCIGATIAELLIRAGVYKINIIDPDIVKIGNMARHILEYNDVGKSKAISVAHKLNAINPHARVDGTVSRLHLKKNTTNIPLESFNIIVDCTGNNQVLDILSTVQFSRSVSIFTVSIGMWAKRLYVGMCSGKSVDFSRFLLAVTPFIKEDIGKSQGVELPRDGFGCWHPTFPARVDDIWSASTTAFKAVETYLIENEKKSTTLIFERNEQEGYFSGYKLIKKEDHD